MALQTEIWVSDIQETLYEGSEFVNNAMDDSAFIENKTVHLPQAGATPAIVVDRSSLPATITQRTDSELTYNMREFSTDPIVITDIDELQTSYAKRTSVLGQHIGTLNERIGTETAQIWTPEGSSDLVLRTTGAGTADQPAGTTGTRRLTTKEDISKMAKKLDLDNVPMNDRFLLMTTSMYYELFQVDALIRKDFMDKTALPSGVINQIFGFNVMVRPTVSFHTAADAKLAVGATPGTTDSFSCIGWQKASVRKALGSIKVFADEDKPEYYGSLFSALIMHGAEKSRSDDKGLVALSQGVV